VANEDESVEPFEDLPTLRSQRRFVEVMSIVSAAYYWFDIRINTESSLLGQSVHIGSTRYALAALWIGLIWSAWRYGQHLYQLWPDLTKDVRNDFALEMSRLANGIVRRYLARLPLVERKEFGDEKGVARLRRRAATVERFDSEEARQFDEKGKEIAPALPRGPLGAQSHSVIHTEFEWLVNNSGNVIDYDFGIGRFQAAWLWVRAATAAGFRRPAVLDYATPIMMFVFATLSLVLAMVPPIASSKWI
jgi:hypothetical protein